MLIDPSNKQKFIEQLNHNFRTVLSYGEDEGLVPVGQFIIKDIQEDEIPSEYGSRMSDYQLANVILTKIDDENVQIVLPMTTFLREYSDTATRNADRLSNLSFSVEDIERIAEEKVLNDETLQELLEADTISLDKSGAEYRINGEVQSSNYSICPINLGKTRERIRENSFERESGGKFKGENRNHNYYEEDYEK